MADVLLRGFEERDLPTLQALRSDPALQHLLLAHPSSATDEAAVRDWINRRTCESGGLFRIIADESGSALGFVQVTDVHKADRYGYLGICVRADRRGGGVGRAAMLGLLDLASRSLGLRKLLLHVRADNAAALGLYTGLQFRQVGVLTAHYDDGSRTHDVVLMERILVTG